MQMVWKKNKRPRPLPSRPANLPFESSESLSSSESQLQSHSQIHETQNSDQNLAFSEQYQSQGNGLAEEGKYWEALGKWEAAVTLTPERAVLHEQKAQVLLELGETWKALQAATRATELQPSWPEAWLTLSRAQLNFGEPELSIQSSKKALQLQPNCKDAQVDMEVAMCLLANKQLLKQSGLKVAEYRYTVGDCENGPSDLHDDSENLTGASLKSVEIDSPGSADKTLDASNEDCFKNVDEISVIPQDQRRKH